MDFIIISLLERWKREVEEKQVDDFDADKDFIEYEKSLSYNKD